MNPHPARVAALATTWSFSPELKVPRVQARENGVLRRAEEAHAAPLAWFQCRSYGQAWQGFFLHEHDDPSAGGGEGGQRRPRGFLALLHRAFADDQYRLGWLAVRRGELVYRGERHAGFLGAEALLPDGS